MALSVQSLWQTMKTYHAYRALEQQAKAKLDYVASQKSRLEQSIPKEKLEKSKRFRVVEKELSKVGAVPVHSSSV